MKRDAAYVRQSLLRRILWHKYFYIMLIPVIVWYAIFCYAPMYGVLTAFQDYAMHKGLSSSPWVGLKHFNTLFKDVFFWRAFKNTLIISGMRLAIEFPAPIVLALLINELRGTKLKNTVQTVLYLPHFLSWIICASIVLNLLNADEGLIPLLINRLFGVPMKNYVTARSFRWLLIITNLWKEAGWSMIIFIAAMASIDPTLYEAAMADGAKRFQLVIHITLPGIFSTIVVVLILTIGDILGTGFDQVFNLQNPLVLETGDVINTYVLRTAMKDARFSYATAVGLFNSVISTLLLVVSNRISRALGQNGIY